MCAVARVDLTDVDRTTLTVVRKGPHAVRWRMTPPQAAEGNDHAFAA